MPETIKRKESHYHRLVDLAPDLISIIKDGVITFINEAGAIILGIGNSEDIVGRRFEDFLHHDFHMLLADNMQALADEMAWVPLKLIKADGEGLEVEIKVLAFDADDTDATSVMLAAHDITERRRMAETQIIREEKLREAKKQAEAANRVKSEFLAAMSHELHTPLNAIIGFADIMKEEMFGPLGSEQYKEYVTDISNSGRHLMAVITDILDVSRIEMGNIKIIPERMNVSPVIESCLRMIKERANSAGVKLTKNIHKDLPCIFSEPRRFKQIIINLLSNAVKFTPEGGEVFIDVRFVKESRELVITVSDTGIGMKPEDIPKALSPFIQVDSSLARKYGGIGLGLSLTKSFVEMHEGTLTLESKPGEGTTVTVRIPPDSLMF